MRNKKLTYILIPVVVLLWGYIFFKVFWGTKKTINYAVQHQTQKDTTVKASTEFTYKLLANYRDPFLKQQTVSIKKNENKEEKTQSSSRTINRRRNQIRQTQWPQIKYSGIITNDESGKLTILLEITDRKYLVSEGDEIKGVKILNCYQDSIRVQYKEEEKTIIK